MRRRVVITGLAAEGLRGARVRLKQPGSGPAAHDIWRRIRETPARLRDWPYLGPASDEHPGCRAIMAGEWTFVYAVSPDTGDHATAGDIVILAVFPPRIGDRSLD